MLAAYLICLIVGGVFVGLSAFSGDADHGAGDHDGGHMDQHDSVGHTLVEGAHAGGTRPWLPFTSFRFWTFGSFFFGLGGVALTQLAGVGEPLAALLSLAIGLGGGTATALLVHQLAKPIGAPPDASRWVGRTAELILPLTYGTHSKVRLRGQQSEHDLVVALAERGPPLPKGTRVIVLRIDAEGRGLVAPETSIFLEADVRSSLAIEEQRTSNQEEES